MIASRQHAEQRLDDDMVAAWHRVGELIVGRQSCVDARFDRIDANFVAVDARFDAMEARFEAKFDAMDARLNRIEAQIERLIAYVIRDEIRQGAIAAGTRDT